MVDGTIYRHNNIPDRNAKKVKTFPKHFHNKNQTQIEESNLSDEPEEAVKDFLLFIRKVIKKA